MTLKWGNPSEIRKGFAILAVCCILLGAGFRFMAFIAILSRSYPDVATLRGVRLQIPMQVYSADGELIAQYGEKRRIPLRSDQIPPPEMINAFIATEDSRFLCEHHGIDPVGGFSVASVALFLRSRT